MSRWLTCPRCLASVGNPYVLLQPEPPAPPRPEPAERVCAECDRPVERGWRTCPFCAAPLRRGSRRVGASQMDVDVRRDSRGGQIGAAILTVLVLIGVAIFFAMGGPRLVSTSPDAASALGVGVLVLGVIVAGCIALMVNTSSTAAKTVAGILGGVVLGAGVVLLTLFLFCLGVMSTCKCK
jgi:hypothetical protein